MKFTIFFAAALSMLFAPRWTLQTSGVTARLRGVSAVNERVAWASGSGATVLRTSDGGTTWKKLTVTSETLDFVFGDSIDGQFYILTTENGGRTWKLVKGLSGFRSVVAYVPGAKTPTLVALGPSGGDYSLDDGQTWAPIEGPGFDTFSFVPRKSTGWAAGANGALGKLVF